ncbi:MAG TPA: hypothetical protein ENF57_02365 [Candidatus Korarchaeota archaeon]|nr:MAG: hypothetical protein DRO05_04705 [Candidatus Korarchaeota archaeon]HDI73835.1 hypothetical protein [Candidatus Korarchaeota archaeon]
MGRIGVRRTILIFLSLVILLALEAEVMEVASQERLIIAINYRLTFNSNGTVLVTLLMHPFLVGRRGFESAYENMTVIMDLMAEEEQTASREIPYLFVDDPRKLEYRIIGHMRTVDDEVVLLYLEGENMTSFKGAVVLDVLVNLETADKVDKIGRDVYRITIADPYTRMDRGWVDFMEFRVGEGVELISYSWSPSEAKGPTVVEEGRLVWENFNEPEAPNEYVLELRMPDFQFEAAKGYKVAAVASFSNGMINVSLNNLGKEGLFYIRAVGDGMDQTRAIYLKEGEKASVSIPAPKPLKVEIWYGTTMLGEAEWVREEEERRLLGPPSFLVMAMIIVGMVMVFLSLIVRGESDRGGELDVTEKESF